MSPPLSPLKNFNHTLTINFCRDFEINLEASHIHCTLKHSQGLAAHIFKNKLPFMENEAIHV